MMERSGKLTVRRQCELLGLNRTGVYYRPRPVPQTDLRWMRRIDELHLEFPYYGASVREPSIRNPSDSSYQEGL